jgi:transcriptional regulator with XRE-family HTH domain
MAELAVQAMQEAKARAGKASVLVARMEPLVGRRYDEDSVSAWIRGRTVPPADALLAAARVTGLSVDEFLRQDGEGQQSLSERLVEQGELIDDLQARVERLTDILGTVAEMQETIRTHGEAIKRTARPLTAQGRPAPSEVAVVQRELEEQGALLATMTATIDALRAALKGAGISVADGDAVSDRMRGTGG